MNSFAAVAQFARPNPPKSEKLETGIEYSIGGNKLKIKDGKGVGGDIDRLVDHMAGDEPSTWAGSPSGGHLSKEMATRTKFIDGDRAMPEFTKTASSNSPHNRPVAKWRWKQDGGGKTTSEKISTIWPDGWSKATLKPVLQNAYKTETANMFVSAEGTGVQKYFSFTKLSDGDGPGTAYPK